MDTDRLAGARPVRRPLVRRAGRDRGDPVAAELRESFPDHLRGFMQEMADGLAAQAELKAREAGESPSR
ncbi:hypothetical protein BN6_50400 [Saccharothrix espanaensis DSM 44229]|uniref:Uncharacterized protein n=1 Tax=Saccharothrix espanaensis (strain ATCC 51144 / DSM 44229 / JCM 9112 / NBRC 15066 / NRRL 15764) TaxID=1179773 RepID=K0K3Y8_SACES|nr:hypothetical protein BN6_50400 [Saccharothrix espanaensis DSM 44229]